MIKSQAFILAALLTGVAIGYFVGGHGKSENARVEETAEYKSGKPFADNGDAASIKALRKRIAELEQSKAVKAAEPADAAAELAKSKVGFHNGMGGHKDWLRDLKEKDPERYTQITNNIVRSRQMMIERNRTTLDFLGSVDTSRMNDKARKTHNELMDLLARRDELDEMMHKARMSEEAVDENHMRELHEEFGRIFPRIWELNAIERDNLIEEMAINLGFEAEDSKTISSTVNEILEATGITRPRPPPGGFNGR